MKNKALCEVNKVGKKKNKNARTRITLHTHTHTQCILQNVCLLQLCNRYYVNTKKFEAVENYSLLSMHVNAVAVLSMHVYIENNMRERKMKTVKLNVKNGFTVSFCAFFNANKPCGNFELGYGGFRLCKSAIIKVIISLFREV